MNNSGKQVWQHIHNIWYTVHSGKEELYKDVLNMEQIVCIKQHLDQD